MQNLVPPRVADAADTLIDYFNEERMEDAEVQVVRTFLQRLIDAPHWEPEADPSVHVSYTYSSYRQGTFTAEARIPLSTYLVVRVKGANFSWGDVLGKHSEVDCTDDDFVASLDWPEYEELTGEDCAEQWCEAVERMDSDEEEEGEEEERLRIIKEVVQARLAELGPFLPGKPELMFGDEVKLLKERFQSIRNKKAKTE